jgi:hypothetical protein
MKGITKIDEMRVRMDELIIRGRDERLTEQERELAQREAFELTAKVLEEISLTDKPVYLVNISNKRFLLSRSYSSFWIHGAAKGERYAVTEIDSATSYRDAGYGGVPYSVGRAQGWRPKGIPDHYTAIQIARDLAREINGDLPSSQASFVSETNSQGLRVKKTQGVFISETKIPNEEDLQACEHEMAIYDAALISEGDLIWEQKHDYKMIGSMHHEACARRGVSRDWHQNYLQRVACPGCGNQVLDSVALCPTCGWILNEEKMAAQQSLRRKHGLEPSHGKLGKATTN